MGTHSCILTRNCVGSGSGKFTSPCTRVRSPCHWPLHTCKPGSPRCPSSPHPGRRLLIHPQSLPRLNTLAARAVPTAAWDTAPTPQLQSAQTLLQPRNPPAPKGQPRTARRSLQRLAALTSMAIPLPWLPSQLDANGKMFARKTPTHSTPPFPSAPACLTTFAVTEALPPSITSTLLGLAGPRHWQTTSAESRQSITSLYTIPNFNFPGYPAGRPSNLTPSIPSIAGSHHMLSTWPPGMFTPGVSTPRLTIDQANGIFDLAAECQALSVKLAKEFQMLSGLEAMHHNSIQGTAHETLTLGHSAQEATYSAILRDGISEAEHEAMTRCLCSEADATWKEMHEVMYNHQLDYDR